MAGGNIFAPSSVTSTGVVDTNTLGLLYASFTTGASSAAHNDKWMKVATQTSSTTQANYYEFFKSAPSLRKRVGEKLVDKMRRERYALFNEPYDADLAISRDDLEDQQADFISRQMQSMGREAGAHRSHVVFEALGEGHTEDGICYDGLPFFSKVHPVGGTTVSNYDDGGAGQLWYLMNDEDSYKPLILQIRKDYMFEMDESNYDTVYFRTRARLAVGYSLWTNAYASNQTLNGTNFDAARQAMMAFKDEGGKEMGIEPTVAVVGRSNYAAAKTLFENAKDDAGADNTFYGAVREVVYCPWLP